jgi:hypothetical protein
MVTGHVYRVDTRSEPARQLVERCIGGPPNICAQKNPAGQKVCRTIPSQSVSRSSSNIVPVLHSLRCACLAVIRAEATALGLGPRQILAGFCLPIPTVARAVIDLRTCVHPHLPCAGHPTSRLRGWGCYASLPNGGSTMLIRHSLTMRATAIGVLRTGDRHTRDISPVSVSLLRTCCSIVNVSGSLSASKEPVRVEMEIAKACRPNDPSER